jgi:glycosyltransferase involved in cell wall biosynthesis
MPTVSIALPVYNGERYLRDALDSILAQSFSDLELVIADNASTDATPDIAAEYAERDSRVRLHRNAENIGAARNFNLAFSLTSGRYFKWAAHDDLYHHDYLEACVRVLDKNPDVVLAHTGTAFVDEAGEFLPFEQETGSFVDPTTGRRYWPDVPSIGDTPIATSRLWQVLTRALWGSHMFGVMRREILQQTALLPYFEGGDRAMLAELALLGRFKCANDRLFLKRFHANVSWALDQKELKGFISTDGKRYWRRLRQVQAFFGAPRRKPIGIGSKSVCFMLVAAHSAKIALQRLGRGDPRRAAHGYGWPGAADLAVRRGTPDE